MRSTTVRPTRRPARRRRATPSTRASQDRLHLAGRALRATQRALRAHRPAPSACDDRTRVAVVRESVELTAGGATQHPHQRRLGERRDLSDGRDPPSPQLVGRHLPDAPEALDRKWMEEGELPVGRHDEEAVGLRHRTRHLREELRAGDADRDREADLLEDGATQAHRDLGRRARDPLQPPNVEERLVDRDPFDHRGDVVEHAEHRLARVDVRPKARRDDDGPRAQAARAALAHRGAHAVCLRLVARREHNAASDDHRPAAERALVALLDRRVERVEVGVEDRHERMFA